MVVEKIMAIVFFALIAVFAWTIFKKVFKLMLAAVIIILLLLTANLFFIIRDVKDLNENFSVLEKKVILVDKDEFLTGFLQNGRINPLTDDQIEEFSSYLKNREYKKILGDSYKLMIFDVDIVSDLDAEQIEFDGELIAKDKAISILKSDIDPREKADLFGVVLLEHILHSENPLFFFSEFKKGNIIIYPETAVSRTVKIIPMSLVKNTGIKIFEKTREKAKTFVT